MTITDITTANTTPEQLAAVVPAIPSEAPRDSANRYPPATFMGIDDEGFAVYHNVWL